MAKNLINIEQNWLNNIQAKSEEINETQPHDQLDLNSSFMEAKPYNQLDLIDSVLNKINKDTSE